MNEANDSQICDRSQDLISFLYGELNEREARSFELHRRNCPACDGEIKAFGPVRQSILAWRDHSLGIPALDSFPARAIPAFQPEGNRSALAAMRGFFALSPLWLKGAAVVATVLFCVLAGFAVARLLGDSQPPVLLTNSAYDVEDEIRRKVDEEVRRRVKAELAAPNTSGDSVGAKPESPRNQVGDATAVDRRRDLSVPASQRMSKPLTRAERDQLAADLRLVSAEDYDSLQLLGDRINE